MAERGIPVDSRIVETKKDQKVKKIAASDQRN